MMWPVKTRFVVVGASVLGCVALGCGAPIDHQRPTLGNGLSAEAGELNPVQVHTPPLPQGVTTDIHDHRGHPVTLQCQACHSVRPANMLLSQAAELEEFHQGLRIAHGSLRCVSCHNPTDGYRSLRLADGSSVEFTDSLKLCAQCHGTQARDYHRGAHGGMTGYWDLTRGGRERNHCQHCHDAHSPAFPVVSPVAGPRDRFAPITAGGSHE